MGFALNKLPMVGDLFGRWFGGGFPFSVQVELWLGFLLPHLKGVFILVLLSCLGPLGLHWPWLATVTVGYHEDHTV